MDNSYTLKQDIVEFLIKAKKAGQEWQLETEIAKFCPAPIDEIRAQLLILAAEGTIEIDDTVKLLRVRLIKPLKPSKKRLNRNDPLEVLFDGMDTIGGLFSRLGCIIPLAGAAIGIVLPFFVMESPTLTYVFFFGVAGLVVGGIISKELK